jgi:hypothetical protein
LINTIPQAKRGGRTSAAGLADEVGVELEGHLDGWGESGGEEVVARSARIGEWLEWKSAMATPRSHERDDGGGGEEKEICI